MNWDEVGAIGQMLGSIAVFVTLGYLAVQVRHARAEMRRSVSQARADVGRDLFVLRADNAQLNGLVHRAEAAFGGRPSPFMAELAAKANMTIEEASQVWAHEFAWWMYRAQVIPFADELRAGERTQFDASMRRGYTTLNVSRLWFQTYRNNLDPDAVRYIDNLLAQPAATPS
jgi:hypothetical protein